MTMEEQQRWFSDYREEFNHERPHEATAGATPERCGTPRSASGMAVFLTMPIRQERSEGEIKGDLYMGKKGLVF